MNVLIDIQQIATLNPRLPRSNGALGAMGCRRSLVGRGVPLTSRARGMLIVRAAADTGETTVPTTLIRTLARRSGCRRLPCWPVPPLIVCPLRFEASLVRRALRRLGQQPDIVCIGPGERGIASWADRALLPPRGSSVLLVGVAGGLCETHRAGQAFVVDRVVSGAGETWTPTLRIVGERETIITSIDRVIAPRDERIALAQRTGAHLVDLESIAFAKLATTRGWRWGIVRGVSDDLESQVPEGMEAWITSDGRTRQVAVLAALVRKPLMLGDLRCLHHNSVASLREAAALIARLQPM